MTSASTVSPARSGLTSIPTCIMAERGNSTCSTLTSSAVEKRAAREAAGNPLPGRRQARCRRSPAGPARRARPGAGAAPPRAGRAPGRCPWPTWRRTPPPRSRPESSGARGREPCAPPVGARNAASRRASTRGGASMRDSRQPLRAVPPASARRAAHARRAGRALRQVRMVSVGRLRHRVPKFLTVHDMHLTGCSAMPPAGDFAPVSILSSSSPRARCSRERTVPIGQPSATAASA